MSDDSVLTPYASGADAERVATAFTDGEIPVAIYGLGKMGLPLAAVYAKTAGTVVGVDVDHSVVDAVNAGESHVHGEPGLEELVAEQVERGRLRATDDGGAAATAASVHVLIVPTLVTAAKEPDLSTIDAVLEDVAAGLDAGDLVILESTVPPGTARDVVQPTLATRSGLDSDEFGVAVCPERTASGSALRDITGQYPKVVGGVDQESASAAAALYDELTDAAVTVVSDATTAEAVKVFEGVYRDVNIALANELATLADGLGISVREAIETANQLPVCDLHDPGPGVGGHCIPYYPHFLRAQTDRSLPLTTTARIVNDGMPAFTAELVETELEAVGVPIEGAAVLVCGLTYRPGVPEMRASPAVGVIDELRERGADVAGVDPLVDPAEFGARPVPIEAFPGVDVDAAVVVTPHEEFLAFDWDRLDRTVVIDARDALDLDGSDHRVRTLGGQATPRASEDPPLMVHRPGVIDE